jgi:outer membrane protein
MPDLLRDLESDAEFHRILAHLRKMQSATKICVLLSLLLICFGQSAAAQQNTSGIPDYSNSVGAFPRVYLPYVPRKVPDVQLENTPRIADSIRDGKLVLSLSRLMELVRENNLDIFYASFNAAFAETDLLRAGGGGAPRGAPGVQVPSSLFAGAIGAGLGSSGGLGGSSSAGGISGGARAVNANPRGTFDPSFAMNFSVDRTTSPLSTAVVTGLSSVTTSTTALQTRYSQAFTTGTTISVGFNNQRQSSNSKRLIYNPAFVSTFSFTVTHQLLNGAGFGVNRRFMEVAKNERRISEEAYRQQLITTLAQAQNIYWDLVAARDSVRAAEASLNVARQLYQDNKLREEIGNISYLDVVTAESEVAARQRDFVVAQTNLQLREVDLKNILSRKIGTALSEAHIDAVDSLPEPQDADVPKLSEALSSAMKDRPELRQAEGNILNQEVAIKYVRNLIKPTLTLFGTLNSAGLYGNRTVVDPISGNIIAVLPGGFSQAFRQVRDFAFPEYAFGFSLSIPILNRSAQADNLRARLEQRQAQTSLQMTRSDIDLEVRKAVIGLIQAKSQVEAARKATELSTQILSAEETRLQSGVSTPYTVIQRQRDLLAAQLAEVQARASYAKAIVEVNRSTGVLDTQSTK